MVVDSCYNSGNKSHGVARPCVANESHSSSDGKGMFLFHLLCTYIFDARTSDQD